jgi:hypothetical protein
MNPTWRNQLGQAARYVENKFRGDDVASQLSELYTQLLISQFQAQLLNQLKRPLAKGWGR